MTLDDWKRERMDRRYDGYTEQELWDAAQKEAAQPIAPAADVSAPTDERIASLLGELERCHSGVYAEKRDALINCLDMKYMGKSLAARAAAPVSGPSDANRYARELATALWKKHYQTDAPLWQVLPDTYGALSQIDNMTTGLCRAAPVSGQGASEEIELLKSHLEDAKELIQKMMKQEATPYGYVWFNHHMEHRFTRGLPLSCHNATDIKPVFERQPVARRPRSEDSRAKVLEEALEEIAAKWKNHTTGDIAERALASSAASGGEVMGWISVCDRLPEFDFTAKPVSQLVKVIAALTDGTVSAMHYWANAYSKEEAKPSWTFADGRSCLSHNISFWMPLPVAPSPADSAQGEG